MPEDPLRRIGWELEDVRRELVDLKYAVSRLVNIVEELELRAETGDAA
jgi:hypothetical protein